MNKWWRRRGKGWRVIAVGVMVGLSGGETSGGEIPPPPILPGAVTEADLMTPEVVVRTEGESVVTEYRVGGRTYLVRVAPPVGAPYFLMDRSGSGVFERLEELPSLTPPLWVIQEWR
ncbi:MAG: DUF2782 domain-containing protein [Hydrogenophilus sp.]|nr:DUF2782 domain-containing protein [Hydrogenophilus sp.]